MARSWKKMMGLVVGILALGLPVTGTAVGASGQPSFIPPDADWLTTVNYYREMAGLGPVVEDGSFSAGAFNHSCYMLYNGIAHDEVPGLTGYTAEGDLAGNNGNVAVSSAYGASARSHIELWMTGPFHAIGVLRPNLGSVGFGKCDNTSTSPWRSGATLDVLRGLGPKTALSSPILFPGDGSTTNLNRFIVESPDPLTFCGWANTPAGLPVIAMMPEAVNSNVSATISGPNGPIQTCALSRLNTSGTAQQILQGDNAVVAIPRNPLDPGTYTVTVTTQSRTVTWSFTVDPNAAFGAPEPIASAQPTGASVAFEPLAPSRIVDTRENFGATRLAAGITKRIQISGRGGVPSNSTALSANFTIVAPETAGYLTVWNCAAVRPVVSTLNFNGSDVTPNAASIPLDSTGGLCVFANVSADLVIDANGFYGTSGDSRFSPVSPRRLMDTRTGLGHPGRLLAGQTAELQVAGTPGIPNGVDAVTLNVTSVNPGLAGYVTVYPCDSERPVVSNLNPKPGRVRPNLVMTPLSASGNVCLYTANDVELIVDVTGYLNSSSGNEFTSSVPFRFTDTRNRTQTELNTGTSGSPLGSGQTLVIQIAGQRGVPSDAKAVSLNLTVTGAANAGFVTAWPCGERPETSTANYDKSEAVSNGAQLPLSSTGALCVFTQQTAHVIVDVNGWWN